jgi:16S rRNA (guanine527-N7)-methyltransferase
VTEEEAKAALDVSRETLVKIESLVALLLEENERQNLVSRASLESVWARHIYDSGQLLRFSPSNPQSWVDLGTGAGFPGLVVAALIPSRVTLIEARKLRAEFLQRAVDLLEIGNHTEVLQARVEKAPQRHYDVISARAFAPLDRTLALGARFATDDTVWILPKGRNAKSELEDALTSWQGDFRLEPSLTDDDAWVVVAREVRRKSQGKQTQ